MERTFDAQLEDLKKTLLEMGGFVEKALSITIEGFLKKDLALLATVHDIEKQVNELQIRVDNLCLNILAKQGPVAKDLRLILSIIKINTDLERMGDQCVNIAYLAKDMIKRPLQVVSTTEIEKMAESVRAMVKGSLDSFVRMDSVAAEKILTMDDEVDALKSKVLAQNIEVIKSNANLTESCLDIIQVARNLERLGDHSTNIAEDVIFAFTGKDIRHGTN
ncbi:MAG: phosphate signaling complex protein PhoU [Pseudobdellovibrio sp.]